MPASTTAEPVTPPRSATLRRRTRAVALYLLFMLAVLEVTARGYWWAAHDLSPIAPRFEDRFYPELTSVRDANPAADDGVYDVLLLAGSVLNKHWGDVEERLQVSLDGAVDAPVRIHNLAVPAHNSRDSMIKYRLLGRQRFDLVVVYHGINDTRANNISADGFDEAYDHAAWYQQVNTMWRHPERRWLTLPYTLHDLGVRVVQAIGRDRYVPTHRPRRAWMDEGRNLKSPPSFARHVESVLRDAARRGDRVVLGTFAYHVSPPVVNGTVRQDMMIWGWADAVAAGIDAHNARIVELAARYGVPMVDHRATIRDPDDFMDACHLTEAGCQRYVDNLMATLTSSGMLDAERRGVGRSFDRGGEVLAGGAVEE